MVVSIPKLLQLPKGPWRQILSGVWAEKEVAYYENPDKTILISVFDRKGDSIRGVVLLMARFFAIEGNAATFAAALKENHVLIHKASPTFTGSFLALVTDPSYVQYSPRELIDATEKMVSQSETMATNARRTASDFQVKLIDARFMAAEQLNELLGEPLSLPVAVVRKPGPGLAMPTPAGKAHLGLDAENKKLEEGVQSFLLTVIIGENARAVEQVLMEGCVLAGVSVVSFAGFSKVDTPNTDTSKFTDYGVEAEPIGLPVHRLRPGADVFIDLTALDRNAFGDISGMGSGRASELIGDIIESRAVRTLRELVERLAAVKEEESKYFAARAIRCCRLLEQSFPGLFDGTNDAKELIAPWLKKIGRVALVQADELPDHLRRGLVYVVLKTLYEDLKKEYSGDELKILVLVEDPAIASGKGSFVERETGALIKLVGEVGVGVAVSARSALDLDFEIVENATMRIQTLGGDQIAIAEHTKKPYRARLRPTLSMPG